MKYLLLALVLTGCGVNKSHDQAHEVKALTHYCVGACVYSDIEYDVDSNAETSE